MSCSIVLNVHLIESYGSDINLLKKNDAMTGLPPQLDDLSFSDFSDAYLFLVRDGRAPDFDELVHAFPHFADQIREQLPSALMFEEAMLNASEVYPTVEPAEQVAGCILGEEIGRGASAIVFRGYEPELDREVAVKAVRLRSMNNGVFSRFQLERRALAKLDHPNIVPVFGFTQNETQAYLVMKLIEGFNFEQLLPMEDGTEGAQMLKNLRSDWNLFAQMAMDIVSGLQHAHRKGIVHRDIKPSNLLLDKDGNVWITDFGLVKITDCSHSSSISGNVIGTLRYMSPEQLHGKNDARSDIYSLGLTLYEIATGVRARKDQEQIPTSPEIGQIKNIREKNPDIPKELAHVIEKACAFSPEDRYQSAGELRSVLFRFLDGKVPDRRKRARKPDEEYKMFFRKHLVLGVVTLALVFLSSLGYLLFQNFKQSKDSSNQEPGNGANLVEHLADGDDNTVSGHFSSE